MKYFKAILGAFVPLTILLIGTTYVNFWVGFTAMCLYAGVASYIELRKKYPPKKRGMAGETPVQAVARPLPGPTAEEKAEKELLKRAVLSKFLGIPAEAFSEKEEAPKP